MPETTNAVDFLIAKAREYGKDLTLVTAGPMTNLADAFKRIRKPSLPLAKSWAWLER